MRHVSCEYAHTRRECQHVADNMADLFGLGFHKHTEESGHASDSSLEAKRCRNDNDSEDEESVDAM